MSDLQAIFGALQQHHVARPQAPLPAATPGISWIWAGNGLFKRGVDQALDICVQVASVSTPGLAALIPHVRWQGFPGRLSGALLPALLADAQRAAAIHGGIAQPIEKQYFLVNRDGLRLVAPRDQDATAAHVRYTMPDRGTVLVDLHSHHSMAAYFSATDDRDDQGLSVSCVIGTIFTRPALRCRLNVYGHRQEVPALTIFDRLGPFADASGGRHADLDD